MRREIQGLRKVSEFADVVLRLQASCDFDSGIRVGPFRKFNMLICREYRYFSIPLFHSHQSLIFVYCFEEGVRISVAFFQKYIFKIYVCHDDLAVLDLY